MIFQGAITFQFHLDIELDADINLSTPIIGSSNSWKKWVVFSFKESTDLFELVSSHVTLLDEVFVS